MTSPKVSVVIPAYNQADYLGEAIASVLNQTYQNLELIVVNDASPDHTEEVVKQFNDSRLKYIVHEKNRHLAAARNTGIRASHGEIIALLDADDYFHPEKLTRHVEFLENHPGVDVTYNGRFELNYSANTIRELVRPPRNVTLSNLVLGFPFTPSDMVIRKKAIFDVGLFDESYVHFSEDLDINCRLALTGCKFASVDRALNYRRHHSGRNINNIPDRLAAAMRALISTFSDSRCPEEVLALRNKSFLNNYLVWAYHAYIQNETDLAHEFTRKAVQLEASILTGNPSGFVKFLLTNSIADENLSHETILQQIFAQFPPELNHLSEQYDWAVAQGYLSKGTRAALWDREDDAYYYFNKVQNFEVGQDFLHHLVHQLISYEIEFGSEAAQTANQRLIRLLMNSGIDSDIRWLQGCYSFNRAFSSYRNGNYSQVPKDVFRAVGNNLGYITDKGLIAIFFRSIFRSPIQSKA